jgi:hypothetical protein
MKKNYLCLAAWVLLMFTGYSQNIAINTDSSLPNTNAILDIKSGNKGILIPRLDSVARKAIPNTKGLLVYDTTSSSFWYNTGMQWQSLATSTALQSLSVADSAWLLTGNNNTHDKINFLGTTSNVPLNIRVNNQPSGRIDPIIGNSFWGYQSGSSDTSGSYNTGNGAHALQANLAGNYNVANGAFALYNNTIGNDNTALGFQALNANTKGSYNTATGTSALSYNTNGNFNTANGYQSLNFNALGSKNTATGYHSLLLNTTGSDNTANGSSSLHSNTTGTGNTATGDSSLFSNTIGIANTANGYQSLYLNIASNLTATGYQSLYSNTTGYSNIANGFQSLYSNTTGFQNTATGYQSLYSNTTGDDNTANGFQALSTNTIGGSNTAIGSYALMGNGIGGANTAFGYRALQGNSNGNYNIAIGYQTMEYSVTGSNNTAVGTFALTNNIIGSGNTAIGANADIASTITINNSTVIGNGAFVFASNKVRIGNSAVTVIEGQVPFTTPSDGRYKFNVQEDVKGLDFILHLRPVTYQFDTKRFDAQQILKNNNKISPAIYTAELAYYEATQIRRSGFIAQEVEQAANASGYDFSGIIKPKTQLDYYSLSYDAFIVPLVKAVQEQEQIIASQNKKIANLQRQIDEIKKLLQPSNQKYKNN